jgi:predicted Zn-dependent peptidase
MYKKLNLENGIPLIMEKQTGIRSLCIGIWIKVGSRYERPEKNGISHFLEHMFFKGTESRSAEDIAMEADSLGGELNALTSTEYTLFYVKVLDEYIERAAGLLEDIFFHSTFPEQELEKEKKIVFEEIRMVEDNPSDYVHDLFSRHVWGENGLGQPVLGSTETITGFTRQDLLNHIDEYYRAEDIVVACSGSFDESRFISMMERSMGRVTPRGRTDTGDHGVFRPGTNVVTRDLKEAHICLGLQGLPYGSEDRYTMHLLNTILGTGYSSRLFQKVREKYGLAYSIYSYHMAYRDTGLWEVYAGTDGSNVQDVIDIIKEEIKGLPETVTGIELDRARSQLKGNLILALESTSNKMTNIAKQEIYYGRYFPPEDVINMVDAVTLNDLKRLASQVIDDRPLAITIYGPVDSGLKI